MPEQWPMPHVHARLFSESERDLRAWIQREWGRVLDVEDVLQQTRIATGQKFGEFDPSKPFLPWAKVFARCAALHLFRKERKTRHRLLEPQMEIDLRRATERNGESSIDLLEVLEECIQQLPDGHLKIIRAVLEGHKTRRELAAERGLKTNTFNAKYRRAIAHLGQRVRRLWGPQDT